MFRKLCLISIAYLCFQFAYAQNFQQQCLTAHNTYRKQHGAPALTIDSAITKHAQEWANHLASTGTFDHRPNNKYGENLYAIYGTSVVKGAKAVKAWYDEIKDYNFKKPGFSLKTGHFTQVVWKGSKKVGCAVAKTASSAYVVCNYSPPGNVIGKFPQNVLKKR